MTQESMDEFEAVQRGQFKANKLSLSTQESPLVQIERYDAAYGFDHAGNPQHDLLASQSARLKTQSFFDRYLSF